MRLSDLDFSYPEDLVAVEKNHPSRVMRVESGRPSEISLSDLLSEFRPDDVLVINNTQVLKRRVFSQKGLEILFLNAVNETDWEVLFPASRVKDQESVELPEGVTFQILERGLPQKIRLSRKLSEEYFEKTGELPLPPYIQKARGARHTSGQDDRQYQTAWASTPGSFAAPTASLHFTREHLDELRVRGVHVCELTLHVGLGTFLPIKHDNLDEHKMHGEWFEIPAATWSHVVNKKGRVWAMGTTALRALESAAHGHLAESSEGRIQGVSELFIRPGFEFRAVDCLLTNFHQPKSTLVALVAAFAGLETVKSCYSWAIERSYRLFSYGDLTVWLK